MNRKVLKPLGLLSLVLVISISCIDGQINNFNGHYLGKAKIIVTWCNQDSLDFDLNIDNFDVVTGKIGNAKIIKGKIKLRKVNELAKGWEVKINCQI